MSHPPLDPRLTEQRNPATAEIDLADPLAIVDLMNAQDRQVPEAVHACRREIAQAIELVEAAFRAGGHLYYVGAGTSGRLGVLDAAECPPTFGTPPELVQGIIAGGYAALVKSAEGAEDDFDAGAAAVEGKEVGAKDVVFGIAASGTTPYVRGAISRAAARGAKTVLLACSDPPKDLLLNVDVAILPKVGPEALTGSTRLKAGTATKLVLNTVTTGAMIRWGKAYGNLMVDLVALSDKLKDRGERIVMEVCSVPRQAARAAIAGAKGRVKTAIVMLKRGVDRESAERLVAEAGGYARQAIGAPPPPAQPPPPGDAGD
jgi:N-acetylmuramic acid 6-phosphate etherase